MYIMRSSGTSPNIRKNIYRFAKDAGTGAYYYDGNFVYFDESIYDWETNADGGIYAGDTYVWIGAQAGTANDLKLVRLDADLTNPQIMTISGSAYDVPISFAGGTDTTAFVKDKNANTTVATYSISGTTATRGSDITIGDNGNVIGGLFHNGTDLIYVDSNGDMKRYNTSGVEQATGVRCAPFTAQSVTAPAGSVWGIGYRGSGEVFIYSILEQEGAGTTGYLLVANSVTNP